MKSLKQIEAMITLLEEVKDEIRSFIDDYYDRYSGLYLKSKEFLKKLMLI